MSDAPSVDVLQWNLDLVSEQLQDHGTVTLEVVSQNCSIALTSLTLDITLLSKDGLANIQLVLSGTNMNDWLHLWVAQDGHHDFLGGWLAAASLGPCLSSLEILVGPENKDVLSYMSALAIHHLIYSCPLVELRLENVLLKKKRVWELVLGGIHFSSLAKLSLDNTNAPGFRGAKL